ncbi:hypothetical protein BC831DRAFT_429198 [Entophlyctis helioformis]|nr:hypothetical protein BC831DRAFT_429198 [Entophlyctis helioformis]
MFRWLLAAASVAVGYTSHIYFKAGSAFYTPLKQQCMVPDLYSVDASTLPPFHRTGVLKLDQFMCLLTTIFHDACHGSPLGAIATRVLIPIGAAGFLIAALESTRPTARYFVHWFMFIALAAQLLGIGIIMPILWVPTYILTSTGKPVGAFRHELVWTVTAVMGVSMAALVSLVDGPADMSFFAPACLLFNVAPIVSPLVWMPVRGLLRAVQGPVSKIATAGKTGSDAARTVYRLLAFASALYWFYTIWMYAEPRGLLNASTRNEAITAAVAEFNTFVNVHAGRDAAGYVLFVDLLGCWFGFAVWAAAEGGLSGLFTVLGLGSLLGPGAAVFLFAAGRERRLGRLAAAGLKKTKTE